MSSHPVEALLRPPVELYSAIVAGAMAGTAVLAPWVLMMPRRCACLTGKHSSSYHT